MKVSQFHNQMIKDKKEQKAKIAVHSDQEKRLTDMGYKYLPYALIEEGATVNLSECDFESERPYGCGMYFRRKRHD